MAVVGGAENDGPICAATAEFTDHVAAIQIPDVGRIQTHLQIFIPAVLRHAFEGLGKERPEIQWMTVVLLDHGTDISDPVSN